MRHPPVSCGGGRFPLTVPRAPGNSAASLPPLVAVAHGSADPRATATVTALLGIARRRAAGAGLPGIDARAAYLGHTPPTLAQALSALGAPAGGGAAPRRHAVVLPLLLTGAYHATTDIPALLRDARAALPWLRVAYGSALGPHPLLLRALERRLAEAVAGPLQPRSTAVVLAAAGSADPQGRAAVAGTAARWQAARGWHSVTPAYASAASSWPRTCSRPASSPTRSGGTHSPRGRRRSPQPLGQRRRSPTWFWTATPGRSPPAAHGIRGNHGPRRFHPGARPPRSEARPGPVPAPEPR